MFGDDLFEPWCEWLLVDTNRECVASKRLLLPPDGLLLAELKEPLRHEPTSHRMFDKLCIGSRGLRQ